MCVQTTLAWGTPQDVEREVRRRLELFPKGGLFLGPTHAIQVGSPLENILTMYRTAGSLRETIDDSILAIAGTDPARARPACRSCSDADSKSGAGCRSSCHWRLVRQCRHWRASRQWHQTDEIETSSHDL